MLKTYLSYLSTFWQHHFFTYASGASKLTNLSTTYCRYSLSDIIMKSIRKYFLYFTYAFYNLAEICGNRLSSLKKLSLHYLASLLLTEVIKTKVIFTNLI